MQIHVHIIMYHMKVLVNKYNIVPQVSIVEVYNEAVFDLLVPSSEGHEKLHIVKKGKDTVVQVLMEHMVLICSNICGTISQFNGQTVLWIDLVFLKHAN